MDYKEFRNIIHDEIAEPINNIAKILDNHFNPKPKKSKIGDNIVSIAVYAIAGLALIWCALKIYQILQTISNYSYTINY